MTILDRYLLRRFFGYFAIGLGAFVAIFQLMNLFERLDLFIDYQAPLRAIVRFYLFGMAPVATLVLPMALLLATLLTVGESVRANELLPVRAAGRGFRRTLLPLVLVAGAAVPFSFVLGESVVPWAMTRRDRVMAAEVRREIPSEPELRANVVYLGRGGRLWLAELYDARDSSASNVTVERAAGGQLVWRVDARRARFAGGRWVFENGVERVFEAATGRTARTKAEPAAFRAEPETRERAGVFARKAFPDIEERPEDLERTERKPSEMGAFALADYIERLRATGGRVQRYATELNMRVAWPLANLIVVLLGLPLSTRLRRGGVVIGAGLALVVSFTYYGVLRTGQALGYNGDLPPPAAAWLGNAVFGSVAAVLLARMER